jgi:hypothetical protein
VSGETKQAPKLVRMFGLFGLLLASGYFLQGVTFIPDVLDALLHRQHRVFVWRFAIASLDLFTAASLTIAAVGLLLLQRWAKKMWLVTASILALLHLLIATLSHLGRGVSTFYLVWSWMILIVTALSWWYFTRRSSPA